jgi:UDP-GlcNAc:undecaprenyl-phosphate GlcNAc-1-phosphate transferase
MRNLLTYPFTYFLVALLITLIGTPVARYIALKYNIVDIPDARRIHRQPTPYLGGLFVFVAFIVSGYFAVNNLNTVEPVSKAGLIAGISLIFLLGITDDLFGMPAPVKMAGIGVAATTLYLCGFTVGFTRYHFINYPMTLFWFLGITNAANLMDNMNGLSSGLGVLTALFMAWLAYLRNDPVVIACALTLAGAYLGFLRYNFPNAKIFLGDSGSVLLGFSLALLGLMVGRHTPAMTTLAPIFLLSLFVFDTFFVAGSRWARKIHFWEGAGMDHTSHRLVSMGYTSVKAVLILYAVNVVIGLNSVIMWHSSTWFGILLGLFIIVFGAVMGRKLHKVPIITKDRITGTDDA